MSKFLGSTSSMAMSAAAATSAMIASTLFYNETQCQKHHHHQQQQQPDDDTSFRVEVHLMDNIQQKTYLQTAKEGIPSTLRILAIDLPEMRTKAFSGDCHLSHDKIFADEIAPPKNIQVGENKEADDDHDDRKEKKRKKEKYPKLKIAQKALVKSLVQCRSLQSQQRVGVELLEASVSDLNRYKLRKTHQFGNFKYDPGKYYGSNKNQLVQVDTTRDDDEIDEVDQDEVLLNKATFEDEFEAPWNQYAWADELKLRINGQVNFDAPMEKSSRYQQYLFGHVYKSSVPSVSRFWEWPLPKFAKSDPDGVDGRNKTNCRACNKPHAVIANGAALQRVPSSLRLLQKICRKADVPLFVIHDPRVWGGNTHQTLPEALREMRATIKNRVISQALKQQGSSAFSRGRMLGQVETEAKWQLKEKSQRAKDLFSGGKRRRPKSEEPRDWGQLDSTRLEKKLVERGVIQEKKDSEENGGGARTYTSAIVEIARRCLKDVEEEEQKQDEETSTSSNIPAEEPVQLP